MDWEFPELDYTFVVEWSNEGQAWNRLAEGRSRRLERGGVPTPALFTVAAIAAVLEVPLDDLVRAATGDTADTADTAVA